MNKKLNLEVVGREWTDAGYRYTVQFSSFDGFNVGDRIPVTHSTGISREGIIVGIQKVFGFGEEELFSKRSDTMHTYARKVYARLRKEMGVGIGDIAHELNKANASITYYLSDNSVKVREYCDAVRNG